MYRYATTIFLSAFLLFQIQPMIAKFILPWYGGSAAVWTTCMMFFQFVLLLGYLYAHLLRSAFRPRTAWIIHVFLLVAAACLLQPSPPDYLRPSGGENLTWAIVNLLTVTVGLPFFVLSSTGPLIQAWHSTSHRETSSQHQTYRLYALSNAGSILALLSYPFLFEPVLTLHDQSKIWSVAFMAFTVVCFWSGYQTLRCNEWADSESQIGDQAPQTGEEISAELALITPTGWLQILVWLLLAMAPSILLIAVTNVTSQEVASIPFLWILPLSIYLVSLIICFDRPSLYVRRVFWPLMLLGVVGSIALVHLSSNVTLMLQVIGYSLAFFACCMTCHGELERLKPDRSHLTLFYLMVSVGGALGGIFAVVIAPHIFLDYCEFHVGLLLTLLIPCGIKVKEALASPQSEKVAAWLMTGGSLVAGSLVLASLVYLLGPTIHKGVIERVRNEYGLVYVRESDGYRIMVNGRTIHGGQFTDPEREMQPNGYYTQGSGPSLAIQAYRDEQAKSATRDRATDRAKNDANVGLKIGILGLGTGSLVTWGEPNDKFVFYEINPVVERLARTHFTYLDNLGERASVVLGDGRIQLERQLNGSGSQQFDLLFLDAFTSDSIPAHLMTMESFQLYQQHLKPGGVLVAHVTNRFVDLHPVVYGLAKANEFEPVAIRHAENSTEWVLMSSNKQLLRNRLIADSQTAWPSDMKGIIWTDDFTSLAQVVDWSIRIK